MAINLTSFGITKQWLSDVMKTEVEDFSVEPAVPKGENFACVVFRMIVNVCENGKKKEKCLIGKFSHPGEMMRKMNEESGIFDTEIFAYETVIPAVAAYMKNSGKEDISLSFPQYLSGRSDGYNPYLLMEDLKPAGYRMTDKRKGMDVAHCRLALTALAKFHAIGLAMRRNNQLDLLNQTQELKKNFKFNNMWLDVILPGLNVTSAALKALPGYEHLSPRIEEHQQKAKDTLLNVLNGETNAEEWKGLLHGDCWNNNMLFLYDKNADGQEVPTKVVLLDLQLLRVANVASELSYFFYTSTTPEFRKIHLEDLLHCYHSVLFSNLQQLGVHDDNIYSFTNLRQQYDDNLVFGSTIGLILVQFVLMKPENLPDYSDFEDVKPEDMDEKVKEMYAEMQNQWFSGNIGNEAKERVMDTCQEMADLGVI